MADWLIFDGARRALNSTPLEALLRTLPAKPDFRLPHDVSRTGYVAGWEVRDDDTLWLTALETRPADQGPDPGLRLLFPDATGPVPAIWVSQRLRSADAGEVRYNPRGSAAVYARQIHLWVENGRVVLVEEFRGLGEHRTGARFTRHLEGIYGPEEAAFLRAIHADPADAAPRLVYADWLDERNDPRGAIIRLVERLRGMSPEAATRERAAHADQFLALRQGLWSWVLGYDAEAATARPIVAGW